jgi:hypothetical protein
MNEERSVLLARLRHAEAMVWGAAKEQEYWGEWVELIQKQLKESEEEK